MKRTPLARGTSNLSRSPMKRTGRVKPKRDTPRRRDAPRETFDWWQEATMVLLRRSEGRCEVTGVPLGNSAERHHRGRRAATGDTITNLLLLSPAGHQYVTEHPTEAREKGWIVSSYGIDPATVPVLIAGSWWLLDEDGGKTPVPGSSLPT